MLNLEHIIGRTKEIESLLEQLGAEGRGLHEKVTSIQETVLNPQLVSQCRFAATIRNSAVHEPDFSIDYETMERFDVSCDEATSQLLVILATHSDTDKTRSAQFGPGAKYRTKKEAFRDSAKRRSNSSESTRRSESFNSDSGADDYDDLFDSDKGINELLKNAERLAKSPSPIKDFVKNAAKDYLRSWMKPK